MKNIFYIFLAYITLNVSTCLAAPEVNCWWLPFCEKTWEEIVWWYIWSFIAEFIKYVAVISVLSIMISWVMYLVSWWEEEKVKKAKTWIIWSLVWAFLSISAWAIINVVNKFTIW